MTFDLITALVTPLKDNKKIDINKFCDLIQYQIDNGINKFVLFGTTGEGSLISFKEKLRALKKITKKFKDVKILIGISKISSIQVSEEIKKWNKTSVDGYLVLTPYYISTNERGIYKFYKNISNIAMKDIYIYHVKKRTGQNLTNRVLNDLMELKYIKGIKYAMDFSNVKAISSTISSDFKVYLGNDNQLIEGLNIGASGIISVVSNVFPREMKRIIDSYINDEFDIASDIFKRYEYIINLLFKEPNPLGIKYLLFLKGMIKEVYLDPLFGLSFEMKELLKKEYEVLKYEN